MPARLCGSTAEETVGREDMAQTAQWGLEGAAKPPRTQLHNIVLNGGGKTTVNTNTVML